MHALKLRAVPEKCEPLLGWTAVEFSPPPLPEIGSLHYHHHHADIYNAPVTTKQEHRCSTKIQIVVDETY